ncbi:MAG TPA: c-type cytochrome [Dongiaceae bacterium]|jgi:cytochrome c
MRRSFAFLCVPLLAAAVCAGAAPAAAGGDAGHGEELYNSRCVACHSPDANRVGPRHRGVVGRKAGSLADFNYSKALKGSDVVWDEQTLDKWLTNPQTFIPGQRMNFRVSQPQDRADLIAYLKTLK